MARIDFAFGAADRLHAACEAAYKRYLRGGRLVVYCSDPAVLERFDHMLWAFEATAFIPHVYADDPLAPHTPILLTSKPPAPLASSQDKPWLLNLDSQCAPEADQFERVLEIIPQDQESVLAGRERWRQYKDNGHDLHAHDLSRKA